MGALLDKQYGYNLRAHPHIEPPVLSPPVVFGTPGSIEYRYKATFRTRVGETTASEAVTVSNGPATLTGIDFIRLGVVAVHPAATHIRFYREFGGEYWLVAEVAVAVPNCDDTGGTLTDEHPPLVNNSGRPDWVAMLWSPEYVQRAEMMDFQWMMLRGLRDLGSSIHKNGDIIDGLTYQKLDTNQYTFPAGVVFLDGKFVAVPSPKTAINLTGEGTEKVGVVITPDIVTHEDDVYMRDLDQGVALEHAREGADRLVYRVTWGIDQAGQIDIQTFVDGEPLVIRETTERSSAEQMIALRLFETLGNYVVENCSREMKDHPDDPDQAKFWVYRGKSYVQGIRLEVRAPQSVDIPRGRATRFVDESYLEAFSIPGGAVIGSNSEPFDLDGLAIRLRIGEGNYHDVVFTGNGLSALDAASQMAGVLNTYPTAGSLVNCTDYSGRLKVQAIDGKELHVLSVSNDAYSILGIDTGTYEVSGQRLYPLNQDFVASVVDLSYLSITVVQLTHNGATHIDPTGLELNDILGAADTEADAHDGKWDYVKNTDFKKTGNSVDFSTLSGYKPGAEQTYYAAVVHSPPVVKGVRKRVIFTDVEVIKGVEDGEDALTFTGGTYQEAVSGNPVTGLSGEIRDVIRITSVNTAAEEAGDAFTAFVFLKNSDALGHKASSLDWRSAGEQGVSPNGQPITGSVYFVSGEFWWHSVEGDYVTPDSYLDDYDEIELSPNPNLHLRQCVDFRCEGATFPKPDWPVNCDYHHYLGRHDKILQRTDGTFYRLAGVPAERPVPPTAPTGPMPVFQLYIPPYTYNASDITIDRLEVAAMSMKRLNEVLAMVEDLQYSTAVRLSEEAATENAAALNARGIFVDDLRGLGGGDFNFNRNGLKYTAAVDPLERCIRLAASERGEPITLDMANSTGITQVGSVIMFEHTATEYISQPKATAIIPVNPYMQYGWIGTMMVDPSQYFWTDEKRLPDFDSDADEDAQAMAEIEAENEERAAKAIFGRWLLTMDNSGIAGGGKTYAELQLDSGTDPHWSTSDQGHPWGSTPNAIRQRTATYSRLVANRTLVEVGDELVDRSQIPYIRTTDADGNPLRITATVEGLRPHTDVACEIDGVVVDFGPEGDTQAGVLTYQNHTTVKTGASGKAIGSFQMPAGLLAGKKAIKVFSASDPGDTWALGSFTSQGWLETWQRTVEGIIATTEREEIAATESEFHFGDPVGQGFAISKGTEWVCGGWIKVAEADPDLPLTLEIREMVNGNPTRNVLATVQLYAEDVTPTDDASIRSYFYFPNLVGYKADEYFLALVTNSAIWKVWYCRMGETDVQTGEIVRTQASPGIMYTSSNDSAWSKHQEWDLAFGIMTAQFQKQGQIRWNKISGIQAGMMVTAITQYLGTDVNVYWSYSLDNGGTWEPYLPGLNTELGKIATEIDLMCDVGGSGSTFQLQASGAGIILLLNDEEDDYITPRGQFTGEELDKVTLVLRIDADGVNGVGTRSVTPHFSIDDGETWVELKPEIGSSPIAIGSGNFMEYTFETREPITITDASNTSPIVITSAGHGFENNSVMDFDGVTGNDATNGRRRLKNVTANTAELYDPDTDEPIAGNGDYVSDGSMKLAPYDNIRYWIRLNTGNRAVTPKIQYPLRGYAGIAA